MVRATWMDYKRYAEIPGRVYDVILLKSSELWAARTSRRGGGRSLCDPAGPSNYLPIGKYLTDMSYGLAAVPAPGKGQSAGLPRKLRR